MLLKPLEEYQEYQDCLEKIEKLELDLKQKEIKVAKINAKLKKLDFLETKEDLAKLKKTEDSLRIAIGHNEKAQETLEQAKENLKETMELVKSDRAEKAKEIGLKLSKQIEEAVEIIEKNKGIYTKLYNEIKKDFIKKRSLYKRIRYDDNLIHSIIGLDFRSVINYSPRLYKK